MSVKAITKTDVSTLACIVSSKFLGWIVEVANELGVVHSVFLAGNNFAIYFSISLKNLQKYKADKDHEFFILQDFPKVSTIELSQLGFGFKLNDAT